MLMGDIRTGIKMAAVPTAEPLTYAQVKALLQLGDDTNQTWLTSRIIAARQKVEQDTGLRLITQTLDVYFDAFPADGTLYLPVEPLQSVTSLTVTSSTGTAAAVAATNYTVDVYGTPPRIALSDTGSWPGDVRTIAGIVVKCVVGYGTAGSDVPQPLVWAMEQLIASWYAARVGAAYVPPPSWMGYDSAINQYRIRGIA